MSSARASIESRLTLEESGSAALPPRRASVFGSALAVSCFFVLSTGVNFVLSLYLASRFGASAEMDAYVASSTIPVFTGMVLAGSIAYPLQVNLVHLGRASEARQVWGVCAAIAAIAGGFTLAIAAAVAIWAPALVSLTTPGLKPAAAALSATLLRLQSPLIVLAAMAVIAATWHNAAFNFLRPAGAQLIGVLTTLIMALLGAPYLGVAAVALGTVGGTLLQLLVLMRGAAGVAGRLRKPDFDHPAVARILFATVPLLLGAVYVKTDTAIDRYLASALPSGSISQLGYGWSLTTAMSGAVMTGLAPTSLSAMAEQVGAAELGKLRATFVEVMRMLAFLLAPVVTLIVLAGPAIVALLLQHGRFTAVDSRMVGLSLACYAGLLIGHPAGTHLSNIFYAGHDTRTPALCLASSFTIGIALKFALVRHLGILGLASATSAYYLLNGVILSILLVRRLGWGPSAEQWRFAAKLGSAAAAMAAVVLAARWALAAASRPEAAAGLLYTGAGGAAYLAAALAVKIPESRIWLDGAIAKLRWARS